LGIGDIGDGSARRSNFLRFECNILFLEANKLSLCRDAIVEDNGVNALETTAQLVRTTCMLA
jgi:hypothetical protein